MIRSSMRVVGIFAHLDSLTSAIEKLRHMGYGNLTVFSPVPRHEIEESLGSKKSPVRFFTLTGGLFGGILALFLTIGTSLHYPLITGGKPIVSVPPFLVIVFELVILFGALATILGMLINIRLPRLRLEPVYHARFSEDQFGLWVGCREEDAHLVLDVLREAGAQESHREGY